MLRKVMYLATAIVVLGSGVVNARESAAAIPGGYRLDWYGWAGLRAAPYLMNARNLADGDLTTLSPHFDGPQTGGWVEFRFPEQVHVTALRFQQSAFKPGDSFELRYDPDGSGDFSQVATVMSSEKPVADEWIVLAVDKPVRGLRLSAQSGTVGYRSGYPSYREIEIYTQARVRVQAVKPETVRSRLNLAADAEKPVLSRREIKFTPCIDLWMAGIVPGDKMPETIDEIEATKGFQNLLGKLRDIDAQGVRMFLETYCGQNKMPWTSALAKHYGRDTLRGLMAALHKQELTGSLFLHAWMTPFQPEDKMLPGQDKRWDYPYEQSSFLAAKGIYKGYEPERYPCIISDNHFRDNWFGLMKEAVERGMDGIYVMPDEYYFKGHYLGGVHCKSCERKFKERYGYTSLPRPSGGAVNSDSVGPDPRRVEDSEHFRKWKLFEYEMLAELFNDIAGRLKKINPELMLASAANPASAYYTNRRLEHGLAFELIGRGENYNAVQLYGSVPVGLGDVGRHTALARRMRGSHRNAALISSIQTLDFKGRPDQGNEIRFHGYLLPHIMNGAGMIDLYRLNYVEKGHGDAGRNWWRVIKKGIAMVRLLEEWGISESTSAADTCVLLSRASEDWWYVRAQALMGVAKTEIQGEITGGAPLLHFEEHIGTVRTLAPAEAERKLDFERFRGVYAGRSMESLLIENGVQYDVLYTEREETLDDLGKYKLLVLPFSYSMSEKAFAKIKAAVEAGARLLILDQLAPADEFGNPHREPLLKSLTAHPNVVFADQNLAVAGMDLAVRSKFRKKLQDLRGEDAGYFNGNGAQVEYLSRKTADGMIIYLANWDQEKVAAPVIGLDLPEGSYRISTTSSQGDELETRMARTGRRDTVRAGDLRRFQAAVKPGEVLLVKFARAD